MLQLGGGSFPPPNWYKAYIYWGKIMSDKDINGTTLQGQDYWFDGRNGPLAKTSSNTTWRLAQEKGTKNVPVKFELYDTTFNPLSEYYETDFLGNTIFEYLEDKTTADRSEDKFLGFALTYATTNYLSSTNTSN